MHEDDHSELLRLRDRVHQLEGTVAGNRFIVDDLREWRAEVRKELELMQQAVNRLSTADEIAEKVSQRVRNDRAFAFTWLQKTGAFVLSCLVVADFVRGFFA